MPSLTQSGVTPTNIQKAFLLPGLPHLAFDTPGWETLKQAYEKVGQEVQALNPDVLVIYSAQWISVLGHSFQFDPNPKGLHVDENWYELGGEQADFRFNFQVDTQLTQLVAEKTQAKQMATKLVNYDGFPVDTGTLVVLKFLNPDNKIPVVIVSSNIYCNHEDSRQLGEAMQEALRESGKKAVVVTCSSLSHRFFTEMINPEEDKISRSEDDTWNRQILDLIATGDNQAVLDQMDDYVKAANPEMMFKGFSWLMGVLGTPNVPGNTLAYGPVWGTGNAVVAYSFN